MKIPLQFHSICNFLLICLYNIKHYCKKISNLTMFFPNFPYNWFKKYDPQCNEWNCSCLSVNIMSLRPKVANLIQSQLTLPMLAEAILSSKAQGCKHFWKPSKPCHVGIHWIVLAKYSQMSTHMSGFHSFFNFLHHFVSAKFATSSITANHAWITVCDYPWEISSTQPGN